MEPRTTTNNNQQQQPTIPALDNVKALKRKDIIFFSSQDFPQLGKLAKLVKPLSSFKESEQEPQGVEALNLALIADIYDKFILDLEDIATLLRAVYDLEKLNGFYFNQVEQVLTSTKDLHNMLLLILTLSEQTTPAIRRDIFNTFTSSLTLIQCEEVLEFVKGLISPEAFDLFEIVAYQLYETIKNNNIFKN
jgi:hypothetical protein